MILKNGLWYDNDGKRLYPNARQLKALQEQISNIEVQSPNQEVENATEAPTEPPKAIPLKRTYTKKVKT